MVDECADGDGDDGGGDGEGFHGNGLSVLAVGLPTAVIDKASGPLSTSVPWQARNVVPEIAVSGDVGTVNADWYKADPLTILTFETYPPK